MGLGYGFGLWVWIMGLGLGLKNVTNSYINGAKVKKGFKKQAIFIIFRFKHLILLQIVKFGIVIFNADYAPCLFI